MVTRFAAEKGVEVLPRCDASSSAEYPNMQVLFAGQYKNVIGEKAYADRLMPRIEVYQQAGHWTFLGNLTQEQLAALYPNLDVLVVPSINSTEAFGLVQVEAMMNNVPCVVSALPGVRCPVEMHSMGIVVPIGDPLELAKAVNHILRNKAKYRCSKETLSAEYSPDTVAGKYEDLFYQLMGK
jgi:glycosyltransferase involved in cell wall biosynthesis